MSTMSAEAAAPFILAGNSTFTAKSTKTGKHFTYKVKKAKRGKDLWFASVLTGEDYSYAGTVDSTGAFRTTQKSAVGEDAPSVQALRFTLRCVFSGKLHSDLEVMHDGSCGRCGRQLTHPESLASGLGPECAKKGG